MLISVITYSFNSGDFIEHTIKSVIEQDYHYWEHIIVDGGSTDGTLNILKKYPHLSLFSELSHEQVDAMNKGFIHSKGEIVVYLNAGNYFSPGAFSAIISKFKEGADFVVGNILIKNERLGVEFLNTPRITLEGMLRHWEPNAFCHDSVGYFYRREVQEASPLNTSNHATMDLEFLLDAAALYSFTKIEYTLGCFREDFRTETYQTQIRHDYWQPATFQYFDRYIAQIPAKEREQYLVERRAGYAAKQAEVNRRIQQKQILLPSPSEKISISVIIPTYNCQDYITRAIDSVLIQDIPCLEVLIVDDASSDNTVHILEKQYGKDSRVKVFRHHENKKQGAARNTGMKQVSGDYIFFLDADDWLESGCLKSLLAVAEQYDTDITACGVQKKFLNGVVEPYHAFSFACRGGKEALWYLSEYYIGTIPWNKLYRRTFLMESGIFFRENYYHEDVIFSMQASALCRKYISISEVYINYFQNEKSTTHSTPTALHLASYLRMWPDIDEFADACGLKRDEEGALLLKKLMLNHASNDMVPKLKRYLGTTPKNIFFEHIESACLDIFPKHKEMASNILQSIFSEIHTEQIGEEKSPNQHLQELEAKEKIHPIKFLANFAKFYIGRLFFKV
jgi:glycosyltransferase involved in cell wall biosynthesis